MSRRDGGLRAETEAFDRIVELGMLRRLAFACYQQAARLGAPAIWLDTLLAASEGKPFELDGLEQYDAQPLSVPVEGVIE